MFKHSIIFLLTAALLLVGAALSSSPKSPTYLQSIRPLEWADQDADGSKSPVYPHCTTFSINGESGLFLTAGHCIDGDSILRATIDGKIVKVVKVDQDLDLAILKVNVLIPDLRLAPTSPSWNEPVHTTGFLNGNKFYQSFTGIVANPSVFTNGYDYTLFDLNGGPGTSGAPILNSKDEVISVMKGGGGGGFSATISPQSGGVKWDGIREFCFGYWRGL